MRLKMKKDNIIKSMQDRWNFGLRGPFIDAKRYVYRELAKKYGFEYWYSLPINDKEYPKWIIKTVERLIINGKLSSNPMYDAGCGLGDTIGGIKWSYGKYGGDINEKFIKLARVLHPSVKFYHESLEEFAKNNRFKKLSCLIMTAFIYCIPEKPFFCAMTEILDKIDIDCIITDRFYGSEKIQINYPNNVYHDVSIIMASHGYNLYEESAGFVAGEARRHMQVWVKK